MTVGADLEGLSLQQLRGVCAGGVRRWVYGASVSSTAVHHQAPMLRTAEARDRTLICLSNGQP